MITALCLAPLIMAGWAIPLSTAWHQSDLTPTALISAQSCTTGPGVYAKATMTGAYMAGVQYGFGVERHGFEYSVKPQFGLSYVDHKVRNLPAREQYALGVEANMCHGIFCSGVSYVHMSNGNALGICWSGAQCRPNNGEDLIAFTAGIRWR